MVRLVVFILVFFIFLGFIVLNMQNRSDLSFGFVTLTDIPVFLSVLCSFMLGMLFSIPLAFTLRRKKHDTPKPPKKSDKPSDIDHSVLNEIAKETGPYGIN